MSPDGAPENIQSLSRSLARSCSHSSSAAAGDPLRSIRAWAIAEHLPSRASVPGEPQEGQRGTRCETGPPRTMRMSSSLHELAEKLGIEEVVHAAGGRHSGGQAVAGQAGPHRGLPGNGTRSAIVILGRDADEALPAVAYIVSPVAATRPGDQTDRPLPWAVWSCPSS